MPVPAIPSSLLETVWVAFAASLHGSGYERIASAAGSDATIRRRLQD
jgi:hypothetical protein